MFWVFRRELIILTNPFAKKVLENLSENIEKNKESKLYEENKELNKSSSKLMEFGTKKTLNFEKKEKLTKKTFGGFAYWVEKPLSLDDLSELIKRNNKTNPNQTTLPLDPRGNYSPREKDFFTKVSLASIGKIYPGKKEQKN